MEKKTHTCEELQEVIRTLRSENGCPWDRAQTFHSLRSCLMEETSEYIAAVRIYEETGNAENMREELGDLLLQVLMNSRIAEEEQLFTFSDVVEEICAKMIRRHPHIFRGQAKGHDDGSQKSWDEIKKQEKEGKTWIKSPLREIPAEHPALTRAPKVLKKLDKLYRPCEDEGATLLAMKERLAALSGNEEPDREERRSVLVGDLLLAICNLGRIWNLPLERLLQDRIEDLIAEAELPEKD